MEGAVLVAIALSNVEHCAPSWKDFVVITVLLLFINSAIGFYKERNAGNTAKTLTDSLEPEGKIKCVGSWPEIESVDLSPGDSCPAALNTPKSHDIVRFHYMIVQYQVE